MKRTISFWDICDAKRRNDEAALSDRSLFLAVLRVKATGATTCGVVRVAQVPGHWEPIRHVLRSVGYEEDREAPLLSPVSQPKLEDERHKQHGQIADRNGAGRWRA